MELWSYWKYCCFLYCGVLCMLAIQFFVLWQCGKTSQHWISLWQCKKSPNINMTHNKEKWSNLYVMFQWWLPFGSNFQHSICQQHFQLRMELVFTICWISHCCLSFIVLHLFNHCTGCCFFQSYGSAMILHHDWYVTQYTTSIKAICKSEKSRHYLWHDPKMIRISSSSF